MPRLPLIGYSQRELQEEYMRGVTVARREARQVLYDTLTRLMPAIARDNDHFVLPDIPELIDRLLEAWREEIGQGRLRRYELEQAQAGLKQTVARLEKDLAFVRGLDWPGRIEQLNQEIKQTRAERDAARQATAAAQAEVQHVKREFAAKRRNLETELDQADQLIVKYEAQHHQQKAST